MRQCDRESLPAESLVSSRLAHVEVIQINDKLAGRQHGTSFVHTH